MKNIHSDISRHVRNIKKGQKKKNCLLLRLLKKDEYIHMRANSSLLWRFFVTYFLALFLILVYALVLLLYFLRYTYLWDIINHFSMVELALQIKLSICNLSFIPNLHVRIFAYLYHNIYMYIYIHIYIYIYIYTYAYTSAYLSPKDSIKYRFKTSSNFVILNVKIIYKREEININLKS